MNCRQVRSLVTKYADGELRTEIRTQVEDHLSNCRDCRKLHEELAGRLEWLDYVFVSAAERCTAGDELADRVMTRIRQEQNAQPRVGKLVWLREAMRPAVALSTVALILAIAFALLFSHMSAPSMRAATELRSGRQFAYTVRPAPDGTVDAGVTHRRYARIQTPEVRWPK